MARQTPRPAALRSVPEPLPEPRRVPFDAPWNWLAAGWRDIWRAPHLSFAYGAAAALGAGVLVLALARLEAVSLFLALAGGFLLIGPLLAVGLYEASRRHSRGQPVELRNSAGVWRNARGQLGFFGAMLLFVFLVWLQLAFLLLMLFLGGAGLPPPSRFMHELLFTPHGLGLLIVGTSAGAMLAALAFAMSALAVPMLLVREIDAVTAARAGLAAVVANPKPMALWAGLIVVIMAAGFVTLLAGLVLAFPLIGHGTWHAYADIYGDQDGN